MILVDTSVWIDHFRVTDATLVHLLDSNTVVAHPWVTGELAMGKLTQRAEILRLLRGLPQATVATDDEVLRLIERETLYAKGIGYVDAQLLAATRLTSNAKLWTRDKGLSAAGARLGLAALMN